ncbi:hypothetical protein ACP3V3_16785 [Vibrio sp. PNB22_3_1]
MRSTCAKIQQMSKNLEPAEGIKVETFNAESAVKNAQNSKGFNCQHASASVYLSGRFNESGCAEFRGEIRVFLREEDNGRYRYSAMLSALVGTNHGQDAEQMFQQVDQGPECPFIYANCIDELLAIAANRMSHAAERARAVNYSPPPHLVAAMPELFNGNS